ncbi:MAG: glycosyltransferase 87 family protein [Bryobacteraceae bacterium]
MTAAPAPSLRPRRRWWLAPAAAAGLAALALGWLPTFGKIYRGSNDFLAFYAGARLVGTPDLYDAEAAREIQASASGMTGNALRFIRLPFFAAGLWPLGTLPYPYAYWIFQGLSLAALAAFLLLWPGDRAAAAVLCCWSVPLSMNLASGQDVTFLLLWLALALRFHGKHPAAAGALLALCAAKFHLFFGLPLLLLAQRRWRMTAGFAAAGAALAAVSFAVSGPHWPAQFLAAVTAPSINPGVKAMPNLNGLLAGAPAAPALEIALAALTLGLVWRAARRREFGLAMAAALAGGILVSHHAYPTDCALLIPAGLLVLDHARQAWLKWLLVVLLAPFAYFFLLAQIHIGAAAVPLSLAALVYGLAHEGADARN